MATTFLPQRLSVSEGVFDRIRSALLKPCGNEQALFAFLARSGERLLVSRIFAPSESDYLERTGYSVEWVTDFRLGVRLLMEEEHPDGILYLHSHPFAKKARFSTIDAEEDAGRIFDFNESDPDCLFVRGVFGQDEDGFTLEAFPDPGQEEFEYLADGAGHLIPEIEIYGREGIRILRSHRTPISRRETQSSSLYFQRNAVIRKESEEVRISGAKVVIIGSGGIGAEMVRLMAMAGVRHLTVVDGDLIGPENFNRLDWATPDDIGRPKVEKLSEHMRAHDPGLKIDPIPAEFPSAEALDALESSDLVLVGVDDDRVRYDLLRWCVRHLRPAVDAGSGISLAEPGGREGERSAHVWVYFPGTHCCWMHMGLDTPLLWDPELREARKAAGYVVDAPSLASPGSIQTQNARVAALAVAQAEQILLGRHPGPNMSQESLKIGSRSVFYADHGEIQAEPDCPLCGRKGLEGTGGDPFDLLLEGSGEALSRFLEGLRSENPKPDSFSSVAGSP